MLFQTLSEQVQRDAAVIILLLLALGLCYVATFFLRGYVALGKRFSSAIIGIACASLVLCGFVWVETEKEFQNSIAQFRQEQHERNALTQKKVEAAFLHIYENLRLIGSLPSVRMIDRHAKNLTENDRIAIQGVYNNLAGDVDVSEVYILPDVFNPDEIDPATGKAEAPIISFDQLIVGRTADDYKKVHSTKGESPVEEVEIYEYRLLKEQIAWMKERFPQMSNFSGQNVPAIGGREVITCDNTHYSVAHPDDADRSGMVYSVPYYDMQGQFKGVVAAIFLTSMLRELMPEGDFALVNSTYHQRILAKNPSETIRNSLDWFEKEQPNPNLLYSEILPLSIQDGGGAWKIWSVVSNQTFYDDARNRIKLQMRDYGCGAILALSLIGITLLYFFRKHQLRVELALIAAREAAESESTRKSKFLANIIDNTVDGLVTINDRGQIQSFNHAAEEMFGYSVDEIIGQNVSLLMPEPYAHEHDSYLDAYHKTGQAKVIGIGREVVAKRKNGEVFPLDLAVSAIVLEDGTRIYSGILRDISVRKKLEETIKQSEERTRHIFNTVDDGIYTLDMQGRTTYANAASQRITGYTLKEMAGKHQHELLHHSRADGTPYPVTECPIYKAFTEGCTTSVESDVFWRKDGSSYAVEYTATPLRDHAGVINGAVICFRDITHRKAIQQKLKESEDRFQRAVVGSNNGLWDLNFETSEVYFSPRFKELLGYTDEEMRASFEDWGQRLHPDDKARVFAERQKHLEHKGPYDIEYRLKVKSGDYKWFRSKGQATWDKDGKPLRMAGSLSDISRRKEVEAQLIEAKNRAEEATRLKAEFLANMSHEIRTPMNGVIGMTNLLLDTELSASQKRYAETVVNSAESLLQIINDILDFSKIEAGKIDLEAISFDLQILCEDVCEMMAFKAHEKRIELLIRYPHDAPRFCIGDPSRVRQILFNLVNNAIKFTDNGHVLLAVSAKPAPDGKVAFRIEIEDTGIGIPADKVDVIFNKFSQADQSTSRKFGGTGLGLSICRELSRMMGGNIGVRSTHGVGSTFWFEIVLEEDKSGVRNYAVPVIEALKGLRILVVDDNETARTITTEQLLPYGVQITEAKDGKEAMERLQTNAQFDIAVIDYMMPHMDGEDLGRQIKQNPETEDISLLMITSAPQRGDKDRMEAIGFAGYLNKPLAHWQLRDALSIIAGARKENKTIPIVTQHNLKEAKPRVQPNAAIRQQFNNVHILLAEDNPVNQTVAMKMLEKYGCRVTVANNGEEAVKHLKQRNFDLVFMDCQMPIMDGYEAARTIRKLEEHQNRMRLPIVAFTAHAMRGDDKKCIEAGMDDFITKPVRQSDLERVLMQWLPEEKRKGGSSDKTEGTANRQTTETVLDPTSFDDFKELMGDNLTQILNRHFEISDGYLRNILSAADAGDFKTLVHNAHPFASSSKQVGIVKVGDLAKKIEFFGNNPTSDLEELRALVKDITVAQEEARQVLAAYLKKSRP